MAGRQDHRIPLSHRLTVRLTAGVIAALLIIGVPFLFVFHSLQRRQQFDALSKATTALSRVMLDGVRSSMIAGEPHLFDEALRNVAKQPEVERILLIDHEGRVKLSSDAAEEGRIVDRRLEGTCRVCHGGEAAAPPASRTIVAEKNGRRVFRAMSVVPNEPRCHRCHDSARMNNGIMVMDLSLGESDRRFFANIEGTLALGSVMVLLTIAVLVFLLRRLVHAPLGGVVEASRRIADGDLSARAEAPPRGEFGVLAASVNRMTDHLARSIDTVESQRRELQEILEAVDDEIVVLDRDRRVVATNKAFRSGCAPGKADVTGQLCPEVSGQRWPCEAQDEADCPVNRVFSTGRLHKGIVSKTGPAGRTSVIEIHASPLRGADGTITHVVEVRRDISERRQMEASLAQSERLAALGLLASGISHEINNPLGAIYVSVEGLRRRLTSEPEAVLGSPDEIGASLGRIAEQVQRGRTITDRLLRATRVPGASRTLVDVNRVIEDIAGILSAEVRRHQLTLRLDLAPGLPPLSTDEALIAQIVMNLTMNAIQAMEAGGGDLSITTTAPEAHLEVTVRDTGGGIPPSIMERIYEPFFTTKPPGKGTGLGLFITHRIVSEMGGTIGVESSPGCGTVFTVKLPRRAEAAST